MAKLCGLWEAPNEHRHFLAPACRSRLSLGVAPLAREQDQPPRTHDKFHGKKEKQHGARNATADRPKTAAEASGEAEEHSQDPGYVRPAGPTDANTKQTAHPPRRGPAKCPEDGG